MTQSPIANGPMTAYSDLLVDFLARPVPEAAREATRLRIVDCLGIGIAAVNVPPYRAVLETAKITGGQGPARILAHETPLSLSPGAAALANAVAIHALDFDDTFLAGAMHISALTLAAGLAAADECGCDLERLVDGVALGTEVACWLGAISPQAFHKQGYQPTALIGAIGAAVTAAYVLGLDEKGQRDAFGTVTSVAAGLTQFEESWVKNWNVGWAAQTGLTAAYAAKFGFNGPQFPIEGAKGLFAAHLGAPIATETRPGAPWLSNDIALKKFGCCHFIHASIEAALDIAPKIEPHEIAKVEVLVPEIAVGYTARPIDIRRRPTTVYRARFAGPWIIARALIEGAVTLKTFEDLEGYDPLIDRIADATEFTATEYDTFPRDWPGTVRVTMIDGSVHEVFGPGAPIGIKPVNAATVHAKFRDCMDYAGHAQMLEALEAELARPASKTADLWSVLHG